jgi:hypothetical protein
MPALPTTAQLWQVPGQALAQHTLSAQKPLAHWLPCWQLAPRASLPGISPAASLPP